MRSLFRIHLSTAVVLMLIASAFLGANIFPKRGSATTFQGFPWAYRINWGAITRSGSIPKDKLRSSVELKIGDRIDTQKMSVDVQRYKSVQENGHWYLAANVAVALAVMMIVAVLMERHHRRKQPPRQIIQPPPAGESVPQRVE